MLARDKVLFYQHDLAPGTFTTRKGLLRWNLAMGYMLSDDVVASGYGGGLESEWRDVVSAFQRWTLATYADQRVTGFTWEDELGLTRTDFETCRVYANWPTRWSFVLEPHVIPPEGAMVTCDNGNLMAGVFKGYGSTTLTPGDHSLIEMRGTWGTILRRPLGPDTDLTVARLPAWAAAGLYGQRCRPDHRQQAGNRRRQRPHLPLSAHCRRADGRGLLAAQSIAGVSAASGAAAVARLPRR